MQKLYLSLKNNELNYCHFLYGSLWVKVVSLGIAVAVLLSSFSPVFASLKSKGAGVVQGPGAYAEHGEDTAIGGGKTRAKGAVLQL